MSKVSLDGFLGRCFSRQNLGEVKGASGILCCLYDGPMTNVLIVRSKGSLVRVLMAL